jgi:hypothetical protein
MLKALPQGKGELFVPIVDLIDEGEVVTPPVGVVYSTQPRRCLADDAYESPVAFHYLPASAVGREKKCASAAT